MADLLGSLFGEKSWYQSLTAWGLVVYVGVAGILDEACAQGVLSAATCATLIVWVHNAGIVLAALGIRRAANTPPA